MKLRFALPALLAALAVLCVAGCGGGGSGATDPATIAPPKTPLYLDVTVQPEGEVKKNVEALAENLAGVSDVGGFAIALLESKVTQEGEGFDFEKEVEPWLGEKAAIFFEEYEEGENFNGYGVAVQTEDEAAASSFVEKQAEGQEGPAKKGSYEGVDFYVSSSDGQTVGVFDGLLVFAEDEEIFKSLVDASEGESLGGEDAYASATAKVPDNSLANVYVDIGGLIEQAGNKIDSETELFLESVGLEPKEATAVASVVPGAEQIEIDLSSDLSGENPPSGDASKLLGSLPASSLAAFASSEFGTRFNEGIDRIDAQGIPGKVPPHKLKSALKKAGIDLEAIASSIGEVGAFVEGSSEHSLTGSFVLQTEQPQQAKNTVSNIGFFLRASHTPGVTAVGGGAAGFSVHSPELGRQPLVVISKGDRIAIGYGLAAAKAALAESGETLADTAAYKEAVSALGNTPIAAFVKVPAAVKLFTKVKPPSSIALQQIELGFESKGTYAAVGTEASGGLATAKLIVGIKK
ncbi:MAG TPA: DUF3352 domain-containing protein [Solirubrobacterales bacterium]|nr:DUF3352 domain-containing protein [Solirubrobacterales bacterium]